jgi:phosphohistidine phosphatase
LNGQALDLYLLRHADAGDSTAWTGDDAERPLSKKGRKQSRRLGRHLDGLGVDVQAILTSPRSRAADTAKLVGKALGVRPSVDARLDAGFDRGALQAIVGGLEASVSAVVLVGHDPDLSALASWLTDSTVAMRKGAIARIELPGRTVRAGAGALRWLLPPDAI